MRMIRLITKNPDEIIFINPIHIATVEADGSSSLITMDTQRGFKDTRAPATLIDIIHQIELKFD